MRATQAIGRSLLITCAMTCGCSLPMSVDDGGTTSQIGESGSDSEESGTETGGDDLCGGWSMTASLVGAEQPPDACGDYNFTGTLVVTHENGIFELDSCPCDADCDSVDPYELQLISLDGSPPPLLAVPECAQIELFRDIDCNVVGLVIRDTQAPSVPAWWMSSHDVVLPGFQWLVTQLLDEQLCSDGDDDGATLIGHSIRYVVDGSDGITLLPGEDGTLASSPFGALEIFNGNATSAIGDPSIVSSNLSYMVSPI